MNGLDAKGHRRLRRVVAFTALLVTAWLVASSAVSVAASLSANAPAEVRDLARDEARGGHTIARHIGKTDDELRARLRREQRISAASSYSDLATAERVVGETVRREYERIAAWLARGGPRPNLALDYRGDPDHPIGHSLRRGERKVRAAYDAIVVLKWDGGHEFFVLTSYPEVPR